MSNSDRPCPCHICNEKETVIDPDDVTVDPDDFEEYNKNEVDDYRSEAEEEELEDNDDED
jgi:hypothetical protein